MFLLLLLLFLFFSAKFGRKIMYVNHLQELKQYLDLDQLNIPMPVFE